MKLKQITKWFNTIPEAAQELDVNYVDLSYRHKAINVYITKEAGQQHVSVLGSMSDKSKIKWPNEIERVIEDKDFVMLEGKAVDKSDAEFPIITKAKGVEKKYGVKK